MALQVYLSHNKDSIPSRLPDNVRQVKGIKEAASDGFLLLDGSSVRADAIVFATGAYPCTYSRVGYRVKG